MSKHNGVPEEAVKIRGFSFFSQVKFHTKEFLGEKRSLQLWDEILRLRKQEECQSGVLLPMSKSSSPELRDRKVSSFSQKNSESNGTAEMDDQEKTMSTVAKLIEQLHANKSSPHEKELTTARLLGIAKARKEARGLICSHGQAMPLFIFILRNGTPMAKVNVASTLSILCKDEDLRLKVLLGGCIPPLLSVLKSDSAEARKAAAEAIFQVSSCGISDDPIGTKIFVTEGVVPTLWEQLNPKQKQDKTVEGFVTGALRNLCGDKDGYWRETLEGGGVDIIVGLLSSDNAAAQSNAASLLARIMLAFSDSIPKIIDSGAIRALLGLLHQKNDVCVRASAAEALEVLSLKSTKAKKAVVDSQGVPILIGAVVAPSKEC
ncbi:Protein CELLULOSE SYNTHASE INTERACTIVE 3 [Datura stramonium]|uniref:Protein CELLULOSE SYNTHASE INTERACTIVE 3 n=1 Tax=Datura stramonium TaxID=4076 RepID=A0ABS8W337_DATST|nr:Protein CELLULOSE SYNTHASE INTERACTIVE 3 [Datura stramonium]